MCSFFNAIFGYNFYMEFVNIKRKLDRKNFDTNDIAIFFAFDDLEIYKKKFVADTMEKLGFHDIKISKNKNKEIIDIFGEEINIDVIATLIEKMLSDEERKKTGSFYTVPNVVKHMVNQTLKLSLLKKMGDDLILKVFEKENINDFMDSNIKLYEILLNQKLSRNNALKIFNTLTSFKILEPSSGAGTFIYYIIKYIDYVSKSLAQTFDFSYSVGIVIRNIYANDLNLKALNLSKLIAVHFLLLESVKTLNSNIKYINSNWTNINFLEYKKMNFDIIIGNPPYLEVKDKLYFKNETNLYSMFLRKAQELKNENTTISFIIPNSFQTTNKYSRLRNDLKNNSDHLFIESYNDRPSSLFSGVHQRLNIIFSVSGNLKNTYTTEHMYHRKSEVKNLFRKIRYFKNDEFYKLNSSLDKEIINKIKSKNINLLMLSGSGERELLISSRLGLWPKSFIDDYQSKEVMRFKVSEKNIFTLNALFNSSTFYFFWIATSDTWHVTKGNLSEFMFSEKMLNNKEISRLGKILAEKLEKTKVFVNTSQVKYEYKHRLHKDLIDKIDKEIAKEMKFTNKQYKRIIEFAYDYRMATWK